MDKGGKYEHLLQPIKDLAKAWQIDITGELEKYAEELRNIHEPEQLQQYNKMLHLILILINFPHDYVTTRLASLLVAFL